MKSIATGFLILALFSARAQVTVGEFLKSSLQDPDVKRLNEQVSYLGLKPYKLSFLRNLQFRTQNRELDPDLQEYALRFTPANPWEMRNNNRYFKNYETSLSYEAELALKEALMQRYFQVVYFLYFTELQQALKEGEKLRNDQITILEKQLGSSFFDADEYVDLKIDQLDKTADLEEVDFEIATQAHAIERLFPQTARKTLDWDYRNLISIPHLALVVDSLTRQSLKSTMVAYQQQRIDLSKSEYLLEKADINIGFIQTEYDERRVDQDRTPINISLGITIPLANPNKGNMTKRHLETIEATYDLEETRQEEKSDQEMLREKLGKLVRRHDDLKTRIKALQEGNLAGTLQTLKGGDPLVIVQFNQSLNKLTVLLVKIKRDIMITYVQYLALSDQLQLQPLVNYLSENLERI